MRAYFKLDPITLNFLKNLQNYFRVGKPIINASVTAVINASTLVLTHPELNRETSQLTFTYSKSTIETLEKGVK